MALGGAGLRGPDQMCIRDSYYTDKPDWDAFGAMLLVAACHTYNEPVPSAVEKDWNFGEHPLVARLASDEERVDVYKRQLPSQVREFFLLTAGINVSTGVILTLSGMFDLTIHGERYCCLLYTSLPSRSRGTGN